MYEVQMWRQYTVHTWKIGDLDARKKYFRGWNFGDCDDDGGSRYESPVPMPAVPEGPIDDVFVLAAISGRGSPFAFPSLGQLKGEI